MTINDFIQRVRPFKDRLFRSAIRLVDNVAEAEDVVQEVLIKLWNSRENLSNITNLEAWSIRVTRNLSLDKLKSKHAKTERLKEGFDMQSTQFSPAEVVERQDMINRLHKTIQTLPEKQKLVLQLRDIEEMAYSEIAEILDMPMSQVKVNLFRARQNLKAKLSKKELYGL